MNILLLNNSITENLAYLSYHIYIFGYNLATSQIKFLNNFYMDIDY